MSTLRLMLNASLVAQMVKNLPATQEITVQTMGWEDPLREWQSTPIILPGESQGQRRLWATLHGVAKSWTRLSHYTFFHFKCTMIYRHSKLHLERHHFA